MQKQRPNWAAQSRTLRIGTTPAMAASLTDRVWDMEELVKLMDEVAKPEPHGEP
jgi:hypothetical protein